MNQGRREIYICLTAFSAYSQINGGAKTSIKVSLMGAAAPPNFGQQEPFFKDVSVFFCWFKETSIFYFNLKKILKSAS